MTSKMAVLIALFHISAAFLHTEAQADEPSATCWPLGTRQLFSYNNQVTSTVFSNDGKKIISALDDGSARVVDLATHAESTIKQGFINTAEFSPDGTGILIGNDDGSVKILDSQTFKV